MFEILIIDRNKNKNYNWDYQSIIAQITGITNQLFTIHFIWKAPETRWFPVPFGCPHSRSPPSPLMGKPSAGYDLATAVVGLWLEWPPINPTYTYTLRVYIYICMYMHGWMDGWAGLLGVITVHNKHSYESTSFIRGSAINPALLWATARRGPPTTCRFV